MFLAAFISGLFVLIIQILFFIGVIGPLVIKDGRITSPVSDVIIIALDLVNLLLTWIIGSIAAIKLR